MLNKHERDCWTSFYVFLQTEFIHEQAVKTTNLIFLRLTVWNFLFSFRKSLSYFKINTLKWQTSVWNNHIAVTLLPLLHLLYLSWNIDGYSNKHVKLFISHKMYLKWKEYEHNCLSTFEYFFCSTFQADFNTYILWTFNAGCDLSYLQDQDRKEKASSPA